MRHMRFLLAVLFVFSIASAALADTVVFRNVTVVPMTSPRTLAGQTVVVTDGKIVSVGKSAKVPESAQVVDGTGKFLMPGLAEMHGHIPPMDAPPGQLDDVLFLYVANGITTVRGMLGHPGQLALKDRAKNRTGIAPNLYLAGPSFNGNSVVSPEQAIAKVQAQKKEGWDLLKIHPGLTRAEYDAIAKTAREEKIRFGGHVPEDVGLLHAIEMGQETFDHIDGYLEYLEGDQGPVDGKKLADVVARSKQAGVWIVPTSALWEVLLNAIPLEELRAYPELKYVPQTAVDSWSKSYEGRKAQLPAETVKTIIANRTAILRALHRGGVRILMGTDAPQQFSVPGYSLHRELLRMRDAGMSPYDILISGTKNVGDYFAKQDSFGTIEPGKRADLVLIDADPLADITNVAKISGVMVNGRWLSREELDRGLAKVAARVRPAA